MYKIIIFLFIITPSIIFSFSKAPESQMRSVPIILNNASVNYHNQQTYYESIPVIAQSKDSDIVSFVSVLSRNNNTGDTRMQIRVDYFPNILTNTNTTESTVFTNNTLNFHTIQILSSKNSLLLPLLSSQTNTQLTSPYSSSVAYIFPEDAGQIISLISDKVISPFNAETIPKLNTQKNNLFSFRSIKYNREDLLNLYQKNASLTPLDRVYTLIDTSVTNEISSKSISSIGGFNIRPQNNSCSTMIKLSNDSESVEIILTPYYTSVLNNILLFYKDLL